MFGTIRAWKTVDWCKQKAHISPWLSEALIRGRMGEMLLCFVFLLCRFRFCDAGLNLAGDYIISGWFPLHNSDSTVPSTPHVTDCKQ